MIYINIDVKIPFVRARFDTIWYKGCLPYKNKSFEIQVDRTDTLFNFHFSWTTKQDHAGITLELGFMTLHTYITFVDTRHWDDETNAFKVYT